VTVCAATAGILRTSAGFAIAVESDLAALADAAIVVVPSWHDDYRPAPPALLDALRAAHGRGARIVGLCLGAFVLAEAGLLDGRGATTHWASAAELARRHPRVRVDADVLYVDEGSVLTSAGVAAAEHQARHRQVEWGDAVERDDGDAGRRHGPIIALTGLRATVGGAPGRPQ
jgi:transcriptional regulator GlxA family with amidase domain